MSGNGDVTQVENMPEREEEEIQEIFEEYGVERTTIVPLINHLKANPVKWVDFMMKFELGIDRPNPNRTWIRLLRLIQCIDDRYFVHDWRTRAADAVRLFRPRPDCVICFCTLC
jgi:VIT family